MSRVLVTGAASGLGEALTRAFRARGDEVLATDVAFDAGVSARSRGDELRLDITSEDDWAAARVEAQHLADVGVGHQPRGDRRPQPRRGAGHRDRRPPAGAAP